VTQVTVQLASSYAVIYVKLPCRQIWITLIGDKS